MFSRCASFLLFAAGATAQIGNWFDPYGFLVPVTTCRRVQGVYQFVETVNEYDNHDLGTSGSGAAPDRCTGGVGYFVVNEDCTWKYKKIATDPDRFCEADSGFDSNGIIGLQQEFWSIEWIGRPTVGSWIRDFVFTIEFVPGFSGTEVRRIQGILKKTNGCDLNFEGWRVQLDGITPCITGWNEGQFRDGNVGKKRHARLTTSDTSSVSVSDIKDALALIANALPSTFQSSSQAGLPDATSGGPDGEDYEDTTCAPIAGVYQLVEVVNNFDAFEVGFTLDGEAQCNGGLAFLDIHDDCSWSYKKMEVGRHVPYYNVPLWDCQDDSGWDENGVGCLEGEFFRITRVNVDNEDLDFVFAINKITGEGAHSPVLISGVLERDNEYTKNGQNPGCDLGFSGWLTTREDLTPCRDRCYSVANGDFGRGYDNFGSDFVDVQGPPHTFHLGQPDVATYGIAVDANVLNPGFIDYPKTGFHFIGSNMLLVPEAVVAWRQRYENLANIACCESQSWQFSFDAIYIGNGSLPADAGTVSVTVDGAPVPFVLPVGNTDGVLTAEWLRFETDFFTGVSIGEIDILYAGTGSQNLHIDGFALDNLEVRCAGAVGQVFTLRS